MEDSGASPNGASAIFKVLANDICRREILDYVPIKDLVRSERVCKEWQYAVKDYLEHRCALTVDIWTWLSRFRYFGASHRTVKLPDDCHPAVFSKTIEKLGPSVVGVSTERWDKQFFDHLESQFPQLRHLEFKYVSVRRHRRNILEQQLAETYLDAESETNEIVESKSLAGLKFNNLKSLTFVDCESLDFVFVYLASSLRNITDLELARIPIRVLLEVNLLLDRMPRLERVAMHCYNVLFPIDRDRISNAFIECFGRLRHLRRLKMIINHSAYDELLEALARGCKRLECLHIAGTGLMECRRGLAALILRAPVATTTLNFVQDVAPKKIQDLLKGLKAYGCGDGIEGSVRLQGQRSPVKFSRGRAVGSDKLPELKIIIDSLRLGFDSEGEDEWIDAPLLNINDGERDLREGDWIEAPGIDGLLFL